MMRKCLGAVMVLALLTPIIGFPAATGADEGSRGAWPGWVLFDFDDGRYEWVHVELGVDESAWNATVTSAQEAGLELEYTESAFGIMVDSIGGQLPPEDFSAYWRFLTFNGSSGSWEMSMSGADAVGLSDIGGIAWHFSGWDSPFPAAEPEHRYPVTDFRGGPYHPGHTQAEPLMWPEPDWDVGLGNGPVDATPLAVDGRVYVLANGETDWTTMEVTSDPAVFCLDLGTGDEVWKSAIGGGSWQAATPAYHDGVLYVGSTDGKLYAIDAGDGSVLWEYATAESFNGITSSPVVRPDGVSLAGRALYFGSGSGEVYSLALNGTLRWVADVHDPVYFSSPLVHEGQVYIGDDGGELNCLDAATGGTLWNITTGDQVRCAPALVDGEIVFSSRDGKLRCVSPEGDLLWSLDTAPAHSSAAVSPAGPGQLAAGTSAVLFVGSDVGVYRVSKRDSGGNADWKVTLNGPVHASPVLCGDVVYVQTNVNEGDNVSAVYGLWADNGSQVFRLDLAPAQWSASSVTVTDGRLLAASDNGHVYCFVEGAPPVGDGVDGADGDAEPKTEDDDDDDESTPGFTAVHISLAILATALFAAAAGSRKRN